MPAEWKHVIVEWLSEYSSLQQNEIRSFAAEHEHNHEIATAIFNLLYSDCEIDVHRKEDNDKQYEQFVEDVCTQLFSFYRSKELELQRFTLQFVPTLIYNYLSLVAQGNRSYRCIETLLIGIYNFEVVDEDGKPKVISFRLPSLAQSSIYHEVINGKLRAVVALKFQLLKTNHHSSLLSKIFRLFMPLSLGPQFLTESALRRWEDCNTKLVTWGPWPQVEAITSQNRLQVATCLIFIYNQQLAMLQKLSLRHFCIAASSIVTQGFKQYKSSSASSPFKSARRIAVSSSFLLELVEGSYYAMFNEFYTLASQAVKDISQRAQYELFPDVMLVTSAIMNSLQNSPAGEASDGPLGISAALSSTSTAVTMSKSMITNASFRTKKLPDDIPIQAGQVVPTEATDGLTSITEEGESDAPLQRGTGARSSKPKLSSFPVLGKKKDGKDKTEKKVTMKDSTKGIWSSLSGGGDMVDGRDDASGSLKEESPSASADTSDSRSVTTDSLELEPRFAAMQVSSV